MGEGIKDKHWVSVTLSRQFTNHCARASPKYWVRLEERINSRHAAPSLIPRCYQIHSNHLREASDLFHFTWCVNVQRLLVSLCTKIKEFRREWFKKKKKVSLFWTRFRNLSLICTGYGLCLYVPFKIWTAPYFVKRSCDILLSFHLDTYL